MTLNDLRNFHAKYQFKNAKKDLFLVFKNSQKFVKLNQSTFLKDPHDFFYKLNFK